MSGSRLCPSCRALIDARSDHCPYCGAAIGGLASIGRAGGNLTSALTPHGQMTVPLLILVNAAMYVGIWVSRSNALVMAGAKWVPAIVEGEWHRLITAGYLHTQFFHIFLNMLGLWNLGPIVEEVFGAKRLFAIYTAATIAGFVASSMWKPMTPSLGASAGIFGLLGALIAYGVVSKSFVARHLQQQCLTNAGIGFIMGAFMPQIDNAAHAGGLAGGFVIAYFAGVPRWVDDAKEKLWTIAALVSLLLTLLAFYQMTIQMRIVKGL